MIMKRREEQTIKKQVKKGLVVTSTILLLVAGAVAIGGTYSLFSGQASTSTHITTGNLKFDFSRTNLESKTLNDKGVLETTVDSTKVDLTATGTNAFDAINAVPGSSYIATFNILNTGTTAFASSIKILNPVAEDSEGKNNDYVLSCFKITLTHGETTSTFLLSEINDNNSSLDLGKLYVQENTNFTIKTEFLVDSNNDAQNCSLNYSLSLDATQVLE